MAQQLEFWNNFGHQLALQQECTKYARIVSEKAIVYFCLPLVPCLV